MDDISKLLDSLSKLSAALVWPGLVMFLLVQYKSSLSAFFENLSEFSFKGAGIEATLQRKQAEARDALVAAAVARQEPGASPEAAATDAKAAATAVEAVTARMLRRASKATVLWVDDRPDNNVRERRALEALGVDFVTARSTDEAIVMTKNQKFDLIISDMGRPPDSKAGYTLLDKLRNDGDTTPFVIYAASRAPEHVAEARRRGAMGCTNRPDELFDYVLTAIGRH